MPPDPNVIDASSESIIPLPSYTIGTVAAGVHEDGVIYLHEEHDDAQGCGMSIAEAVCLLALLPGLIETARSVASR